MTNTTEVKMTRTDLTKLISTVLAAEAEGAVQAAEAEAATRRDRFHTAVIERARRHNDVVLDLMGNDLSARCTYRIYEDSDEPLATMAKVVFCDAATEHEADNRFTCYEDVTDEHIGSLRAQWEAAVSALRAARARDTRISALKDDARKQIVAAVLGTEQGKQMLALIRSAVATIELPE